MTAHSSDLILNLVAVDHVYWEKNFGRLKGRMRFLLVGSQLIQSEMQKLLLLQQENNFDKSRLSTALHLLSGGMGTLGYLNFSSWCQEQEIAIEDSGDDSNAHWLEVLQVTLDVLTQMLVSIAARLTEEGPAHD